MVIPCMGRHLTARRAIFALLAIACVATIIVTGPSTSVSLVGTSSGHLSRLIASSANVFPSFSVRSSSSSLQEPQVFISQTEIVAAPAPCSPSDGISFVVVVTSHPGNREKRDVWRRSSPAHELREAGIRRVFLLGQVNNNQSIMQTAGNPNREQRSADFGEPAQ